MRPAIAPVTLEDGGGIAGTIVNTTTGGPIAGVRVAAGRIEHTDRKLGGYGGCATSDVRGNFAVRGLAPGVYNVQLLSSPQGRKFTAQVVKGVRVTAGEDARADLRVVEGRRLQGKVVEAGNGQPIARVYVHCDHASHPYSGAASAGTYTDDRGQFEFYVLPGPASVCLSGGEASVESTVTDDRDPDPIVLKQGFDPSAKPPETTFPYRVRG